MITTSHEDIKAMVKRLGEICALGEQHALAGTAPGNEPRLRRQRPERRLPDWAGSAAQDHAG